MYLYAPPAPHDPAASAVPAAPANNETGFLLIGQKTPAILPTRDDFTAAHRARDGMYLQIGASRGPQLDQLDLQSLHIDDQGRVHYLGRRASTTFEIVDNAVQRLPLVAAAPSLGAPSVVAQAPSPVPPEVTARVAAPEATGAQR